MAQAVRTTDNQVANMTTICAALHMNNKSERSADFIGPKVGCKSTICSITTRVLAETFWQTNMPAPAWFIDMQRDPSAAVKQTTLDGHRLRVRAFVEHCGDLPLTDVTRATAADFLAKVAGGGRSNRTTNAHYCSVPTTGGQALSPGALYGRPSSPKVRHVHIHPGGQGVVGLLWLADWTVKIWPR